MSKTKKLGYTFYPKDWNADDTVFELTLEERGAFRELIDNAYLSDNEIQFNIKTFARRWNSDKEKVQEIITKLISEGLIEVKEDKTIFVPSCEPRLAIVRRNQENGQNGGRPKAQEEPQEEPKENPKPNPSEKAKEKKGKEKEKEEETKELVVAIVNDLNETTNRTFKANSALTVRSIAARINEGFVFEDFKKVIAFKTKEWGNDSKMKEFLRPETLFGNKFESYLQAAAADWPKPRTKANQKTRNELFGKRVDK